MAKIDHNEELPVDDVEFEIPSDDNKDKSVIIKKDECFSNFRPKSCIKKNEEKYQNSNYSKLEINNYNFKKEEKYYRINKKHFDAPVDKTKETFFEKAINKPMLNIGQQYDTYNNCKEIAMNYQNLEIKSNAFENKCHQSNENYFKKDNEKENNNKFDDFYLLSESFQSLDSGKFDEFKKKLKKNHDFFKLQNNKKKHDCDKKLSKSIGFTLNGNCSSISSKNVNNSCLKSNISNNKVINKFPKIENKSVSEFPNTSSVNKNFLSYILKLPKSSFQNDYNEDQSNLKNHKKDIFKKLSFGMKKNRSSFISESEITQNCGMNNQSILYPNENDKKDQKLFTQKLSLNLANLFNAYKLSKNIQNDGSSDLIMKKCSDNEIRGEQYYIPNSINSEYFNGEYDYQKNGNFLNLQKIQEENIEQTFENFSGSSNQNLDYILKSYSKNTNNELSPGMKLFAESKIKADKDILLEEENMFIAHNNDMKESANKKYWGEKNKIKLATLSKLEEKFQILKETNPKKFKVSEKYGGGLIKSLKKIDKETNLLINFMDKNKFSSLAKINDLKIFQGQKKF